MLTIGPYKIYTLILDYFKLDGGAMFGSIPKALWQRNMPSDEFNRIPLCTRSLVIEGKGRKILVDVGCGSKWSDKERGIFEISSKYEGSLSNIIEGVTDLVLSHLHFDHAGGVSNNLNGSLELSFPKARHYVSKENYERALNPGPREKGSYLVDNVSILSQADLVLTEDEYEILPGISLHSLYGHTRGMQMLVIKEQDAYKLAFPSDLVPTHHHISLPYIMGFDLNAEQSIKERLKYYSKFISDETILIFEHDRECSAGKIKMDNGRYSLLTSISTDQELPVK